MPTRRATGMLNIGEVDRDALVELARDIRRQVAEDRETLQRKVRLAENLQTFVGRQPIPLPGDMAAKSIRRFSEYVRFTS